MENPWKAYFTFTKKERTGIILLLILIAIITAAPFFFETIPLPKGASLDEAERQLANALANPIQHDSPMAKRYNDEEGTIYFEPKKSPAISLFTFDPNTIDAEGWKKL